MASERGQNRFLRLIDDLEIIPGFNLRPEHSEEKIEEMLCSIFANGIISDLHVYHNPQTGKYAIVSGHRRYLASKKGVDTGRLPADFKAPCTSVLIKSDIEQNYMQMETNSQVDFPPIALAEGYRRAISYGQSMEQISKRRGVTINHIKDCLLLLNADADLQKKILNHEVSSTLVLNKLKEKKSSKEISSEITAAQKKTGKKKIMPKDLPAKVPTAKTKQTNLLKEVSKKDQFNTYLNLEIGLHSGSTNENDTFLLLKQIQVHFNKIFK